MKAQASCYRALTALMLLALTASLTPLPSLLAQRRAAAPASGSFADLGADTTAPAAIVNLVATTGDEPGTVDLSWTAPGDDATTGTASAYTVRVSSGTISEASWANASSVDGEPVPGPAGTVQDMTVSGLAPGKRVAFAIKTSDEASNLSTISNCPAARARVSSVAAYLPLILSAASDPPAVIPETTKVLSDTTIDHLAGVSADGAVFTFTQATPSLDALEVGDVMVGGASSGVPQGFLRRVTSVTSAGGQVIVQTEGATLEETVVSGGVHVSELMTPKLTGGGVTLQGVTSAASALDNSFYVRLDDVVLHDEDGNPETPDDQIRASGVIRLRPELDFDLALRQSAVEELSFSTRAVQTSNLEIAAGLERAGLQKEREIAQYTLAPVTAQVSRVPVVLVPVLTISVGVDGDVQAGLACQVAQADTLNTAVRYADETWTSTGQVTSQFHHGPPSVSSDLDLRGYAGSRLSLLLYGVAGAYGEQRAYLELESDAATEPWWQLYGGVEAHGGIEMDVIGSSLVDYESSDLMGHRLLLAEAQANAPPNLPASPFPADGATIHNLEADLTWAGGDMDGDDVTYDVYLEADDPTPDVLASDDQVALDYDPGALTSGTDYTWRVVATDEHGAATAGPVWTFTTASGGSCPIDLALLAPQIDGLRATVDGSVSSTCSEITRLKWQWGDGVSDAQGFPASHTYAVAGTYGITATAYSDLGETRIAHVTAHAGTPSSEMATVPAGEFAMGCDYENYEDPNACVGNELPLHTIYLDAYAIDKTEVSNAQYQACVDAGYCDPPFSFSSSTRDHYYDDAAYEDHPVIYVSWDQAKAYCTWAGKRLPSEAEWEKAARGATETRVYPWGDANPDCSRLNYRHHDGVSYETCVGDTVSVGSYPTGASAYGVLDMAGNVFEWVNDWYSIRYYDDSPVTNPPGPVSGMYKVLRGGAWNSGAFHVRLADRHHNYNYVGNYDVGFRCAGDPTDP